MKGMSNGGDTQAVAVQLEGFVPQCHIAGLSPFLALVNASWIQLFFVSI